MSSPLPDPATAATLRVAVAGNPNSGKSTLFNVVTGATAKVGNYPGVTVERREATAALPSGRAARFIDLPGCYSLTARSPEEEIAHEILMGRLGATRPDVVLCVVDACNLGRGLYLLHQLRELELPIVVALNMADMANAGGIKIDVAALEAQLGVPVVRTVARNADGVAEVLAQLDSPRAAASGAVNTLELTNDALAAVESIRSALANSQPAHVGDGGVVDGDALWWLTSDLDNLHPSTAANVDRELLETVRGEQRRLDPDGSGQFNRDVIMARYRVIDAQLETSVVVPDDEDGEVGHKLDRVLLHPIGGMAVFVGVMFLLFQAVFAWAEPLMGLVESTMGWLASGVDATLADGLLRSLIVNGVIAGIGNVLIFLPQIALLFLGITLLEQSGYMARAAFLLDNVMRRAGLHGKSFVPLMSSFACAVPGVMAARNVESARDRVVTMLIAPFMSCSARLPVYTLVIAAVFSTTEPVAGMVSVGGLLVAVMYFLGFAAAVGTAFVLKRTVLRSPTPALILELPAYQRPMVRVVLQNVYDRCRIFVTQTGTIILAISILLWGLLTFPREGLPAEELTAQRTTIEQTLTGEAKQNALAALQLRDDAERLENTAGGTIGHFIEPVIAPLGFDWRIGIGLVASFAAREVLVSTLGQVYSLDAEIEPDSPALRDALLADVDPATGRPRFSPLVGMSLMVFFVLAMQCMSTVATVKRETNSWRWPLAQLIYMNTLAYVASLIVFQGGLWLGLG